MKVLRLHRAGDLRLHDEPPPLVAEGEVLVHVKAVGLCGSDRHWFLDAGIGDAVLEHPLVLGHEFAGVIAAGPRAGERVALDPAIPCGRCDVCLTGLPHLCPDVRFAGHGSTDGALRTSLAWPEGLTHPLPDCMPDAEAALLEPLGVALHAVDLGHVRPGVRTGVFGCGPLGLLLLQAIGAAGGELAVATDPLRHRRDAARAAGSARVLEPGEVVGGGFALDVAFETAGTDGALADAMDAVRPGGRVVLVGIPAEDRTSFVASTARRKGLTLLSCRRMQPADLPRAIRLAESGAVDLASLVAERHPIENWRAAFSALVDRRTLKVVVVP